MAPSVGALEKTRRGIAGSALIILIAVLVAAAILRFFGFFERTVPITVVSDRVGLVMNDGAKVTSRGVEIGRVAGIKREPGRSVISLDVKSDQLQAIPANATVHIGANTIFGAKSVNFEIPENPSSQSLQEGTTIPEATVTTEVNSMFEQLTDLLQSIEPQQLNATLGALSNGLNGRGEDLGLMISELNTVLGKVNPHLDTLQRDLDKGADVANDFADATPDIMRLLDSGTDVGQTIVQRQANFEATLANAISTADSGNTLLTENGDDIVKLLRDLRSTTSLLAEYSPALNCMIIGLNHGQQTAGASFGAENQAGLNFIAGFQGGVKPYKYPDDLPKVNAKTGPLCNDLPDFPPNHTTPFVVADTGTNPVAGMPNSFNPSDFAIGPAWPVAPGKPAPPSILQYMLGQTTAQYSAPTTDLGLPGVPPPAADTPPEPAPAGGGQ